ncbi:MAG: hypothetical protein M3Y56_16930 [Armatimonadota bacterium]|nr:hypothetical protein [Armatimonadota bacterium]
MAKKKKIASSRKKKRPVFKNWRRGVLLGLAAIVLVSMSWHKGTARRLLSTGKTIQTQVQQTIRAAVRRVSVVKTPAILPPLRLAPQVTTALLLKGIKLPPGAPAAALPLGVLHLTDGMYPVKDGWIYRGTNVVGAIAGATRVPADSKTIVSLPFDYVDTHGRLTAGNLLTRNQPGLEGSSLLVNDRWWAFAAGRWVYVGKPVSGHTYPGFDLSGGGRLSDCVAALFKLFRTDRHHHIKLAVARGLNPKSISTQDIDTLQHVADAETGGQACGVSTYDGQVVSFGLSQWTLGSGRLQDLIDANRLLFARYGIATDMGPGWRNDPARGWTVGSNVVPRILGVQTPAELTSPYWTAKFFQASLDSAILCACIRLAVKELNHGWGPAQGLGYAKNALPWLTASSRARGLLAELENNRPAYLTGVVIATANGTENNPLLGENDHLVILMQNMARPYEDEFARRSGEGARPAGQRFAAKIMADVLHMDVQSVEKILGASPTPPTAPVSPPTIAAQLPAPMVTVTKTVRIVQPAPSRPSVVTSKPGPKAMEHGTPRQHSSGTAGATTPTTTSSAARSAIWNKPHNLLTVGGAPEAVTAQ